MKKQTTGDLEYVNARNKFIFKADQLALRAVNAKGAYSKEEHAYQFSYFMTKLTEEAGLISKGNLALFNAKLPANGYYQL
jgi:hypothetical protein